MLPPFYIGSTKIEKINKGYHGSVSSAEWSDVWRSELRNHPELFKTFIIPAQYRSSVAEIVELERLWQVEFDVVQNPLFVNKCYSKRGFFGSSASVARSIVTKRDKGIIQSSIAKGVATKKKNNVYVAAATKSLATKRIRGTDKHQQATIDKLKSIKTGLRAWNNGETTKMSRECPGESWTLGSIQRCTLENRLKSSQLHRGASWWTNGSIDKHSKNCPGPDWKKGRSNYTASKSIGNRSKGKFWWTDGQTNIMAVYSPGDSWTKGMTKTSKSNLHN
jgi:hypothetical protein